MFVKYSSKFLSNLSFSDPNGFPISICSTSDLQMCLLFKPRQIVIEAEPMPIVQPAKPAQTKASTSTTSIAFNSQQILRKRNKRHDNVFCNECNGDILGFRYKCMGCADYNLCMGCESKMLHEEHVMVRIPTSELAHAVSNNFFNIILE